MVLPVYNQADHVRAVVRDYLARLAEVPGLDRRFEIILAVNGCRDNSLEVCRALAEADPRVRVAHSEQGGWGLAVRLGLAQAAGELLVYTNCARTSGDVLALLVKSLLESPESVVKALRQERMGLARRLGSMLYNLECRVLFGFSTRDVNGTPKCFPRRFGRLFELREDADLVDAEFLAICHREGYPVREVPVLAERRRGGTSTTNFRTARRLLGGALGLWWRMRHGR